MILKRAIDKDYKSFNTTINALFAYRKYEMSKAIKDFSSNVIKIVAFHLSNMPEITSANYSALKLDKVLRREFEQQSQIVENRVLPIWEQLRSEIDLSGRLFSAFVSRKSQPPWYPVKIDLEKPLKKNKLPHFSASVTYYLRRVENIVMDQISLGVKNSESLQEIVKRVRKLFVDPKKRSREMRVRLTEKKYDTDLWQKSVEAFSRPMVDIAEGIYSIEDISDLQDAQQKAMGWYYTDYTPDMDKAVWARNKALMSLEQDMMSDVLYAMNQGLLQVGSENMGITDFVWITSKPQPECDECCDRDGLTTAEIKAKIKDKYGSQPPRLHPHCRCQLVPKIKDDWAEGAMKRNGYEWNQDSGMAFNPTAEQKEMGFTKMSWDQWMGDLKGSSGEQSKTY